MGAIPSSMVAAVACSAAAGKNPWIPLALIFLLAAPGSVPAIMMDPELHRELHALGPVEVLWSLGAVFLVLAIADSLADKIGFLEKWLVPVSTAWRPFAGVAAASLVGIAAARGTVSPSEAQALAGMPLVHAELTWLLGGSVVALTIALAALASWIATMGKTGARLLMTMVPIPGLKLAHSFVDDLFAFAASVAGLAFGHTTLVAVLVVLYLAAGIVTGPLFTRLTWISVRIGWSLVRKGLRSMREEPPLSSEPPAWLARWIAAEALEGASVMPAYVYRAPSVGRCRAGFLVLAPGRAAFVTRVMWRPRAYAIDDARLARVGYADTATARVITLVERLESGALREARVYLFPAREDEVLALLDRGAAGAGLVRVRPDGDAARRALPGFADREHSVRFLPAEKAGSLRLQGLVTIATAVIVGVLTGGVFVPIGTGYLLSPFKRRLLLGWLASGYLSLCIALSMGLGWPAAVLYASALNVLALRDLTRNALKARVDGYVDRRAFLPLVASRVWVPASAPIDARDRDLVAEVQSDGTWRAVVRLLAGDEESSADFPAAA